MLKALDLLSQIFFAACGGILALAIIYGAGHVANIVFKIIWRKK